MRTVQRKKKTRNSLWQILIRFFEQGLFAPFLLAIQPIWHLYLVNDTEVYFSETIRSFLISLLFAAVVLSLAYLVTRAWLKASVVASLFIVLFFLFGDISDWIVNTFGLGPVRTDFLIVVFMAGSMLLWFWFVQNRIKNLGSVNLYFNLLSILFLLNSGIPRTQDMLGFSMSEGQPEPVAEVKSTTPRPDIYYIILDAYGRKDILQALYDFDNSELLDALKARGFYIADEATSNYTQTMLSLSSSLNMDYLQTLREEGAYLENRESLINILQESKVRNALAKDGYQLVSFRNSYYATVPNAERYYDDTGFAYPITSFESILIDRTLIHALLQVPAFNKVFIEIPYDTHRRQILSTFTHLQEIPALDGDYFAYAHIIAPHPPFVFDAHGQAVPHKEPFKFSDGNHYIKNHSRQDYITGYRNQIQYINQLTLKTVDAILAESATPPIIIIQGDHGPGSHLHQSSLEKTLPAERFSILNAYYFPGQDYTSLYPSISPVNSFRVVLNHFFGSDYALLPDKHYYSAWSYPFDFVEVTNLSLPPQKQP